MSNNHSENCKIVNLKEVKVLVQQIFDDSTLTVQDYCISPFSQEKLGFVANHLQLKIVFQKKNSENTETVSLFVKTMPEDTIEMIDRLNESGIFSEEVFFFEELFPRLSKNYTGKKWSPDSYLIKKDTIVMEDLRSQGYNTRGRFFDDTVLLKSTLDTIARFHSCSILAETEFKTLSDNNTTLQDYYPKNFREKLFPRNTSASRLWLEAGASSAASVADKIGLSPRIVREAFEKVFDLVKASKKHRNVVCHGDLWTNNIMFDDTKPVPKSVLVDFQMIRYAPLVLDVILFLYLNTTRDYRDEHERELIEFYHGALERSAGEVPTLEETLEAYEDLRLFGPIAQNSYFSVVLLDPETTKELGKSPRGFENLLLGNRAEIVLAAMEKCEFYRNKMVEAVTELVEVAKYSL